MKIESIIFDLDGTLYTIDNSKGVKFTSSKIYEEMKKKACNFLAGRLNLEINAARQVYENIGREFNMEFSQGVEAKFGIDRYEWFNNTWDLNPEDFIKAENRESLFDSFDAKIAVLTAAPKIWASRVLDYLGLSKYKNNLFTGEPDLRKPNPDVFRHVCNFLRVAPERTVSVGDRVSSDILPAKAIGMKTVLIRDYSKEADYCINSLNELPELIKRMSG